MAGPAGEARADTGRRGAVGILLAVLLSAAVGGFLVGAVVGEDRMNVSQGLVLAAAFVLLAVAAAAWAWWSIRRRAATFGLSTSRYLRVGRRIQRGEAPEDQAGRAAAIDIVTRRRRALGSHQRRWVWWLLGGGSLLWFVGAVLFVLDHNYGRACYNLGMSGLLLVNPLTMRRRRRRLDAAERALGIT